MGITGLLPLMKPATTDVKLSKLSGTVAAIDTNGWIHRACYSCGDKVFLKEETDMYINYCVNMAGVLQKHDITPILVFDGQSLPAKAETKAKRAKRKAEVRQKIEEMISAGDMRGARWLMRQCVDVTFEMVHRVIVRCREEKIDCIVAPFEADAQITYLVNQGIADYAITEDSDLLVFGCRKTLYKLDKENEKGSMLCLDKLDKCFKNFCEKKFQYMCILSGCDYLQNIPNVGMGRARKFFESLTSIPMSLDSIRAQLKTIPTVLNMAGKVKVTNEYIDSFVRAVQTFDHQLVYSPFTGQLKHLKNLKGGIGQHHELRLGEYAGDFFNKKNDEHFTTHYVLGNVHTKTLERMDHEYNPFLEDSTPYWHSQLIQDRINSKKSLMTTIGDQLYVPESPFKSRNDGPKRKVEIETVEQEEVPETPLKRIRQSSIKRSTSTTLSSVKNSPRKSIGKKTSTPIRQSVTNVTNDVESKKQDNNSISMEQCLSSSTITTTVTANRASRASRNIFRRSSTELKSIATNDETKRQSIYFKKTTATKETVIVLDKDSNVSANNCLSNKRKSTSSLNDSKKAVANNANSDQSDESDFDDYKPKPKLCLPKPPHKVDLNASVSSIEEEDRVILTSMNSQSSGYCTASSQATSIVSRSSISISPPVLSQSTSMRRATPTSNAFTRLKSPVKSQNSKKLSTSKAGSSSSKPSTRSSTNATPPTQQKDIRSFFSKRTPS